MYHIEQEFRLIHPCNCILIPSGDIVSFKKGQYIIITRILGNYITFRNESDGGIYWMPLSHAYICFNQNTIDSLEIPHNPLPPPFSLTNLSPTPILNLLRYSYDPQLPFNIVDLGLIYDLQITPYLSSPQSSHYHLLIQMTLLNPYSGMSPHIIADIKTILSLIQNIHSIDVQVIWDPQWTPDMAPQLANHPTFLNYMNIIL